ncbi:MAG: radical SAM protein [Acidobacteria bacterium]|nr:MAG: radical SAM protein [Acidobacteriota bacterium]
MGGATMLTHPAAGRFTTLRLAEPQPACRRLVVILIRPSKYDDEGYVIRHFRGTLPSNTLSCLNSLTEDAVRHGALGDIDVHVEVIDEIVSRVDPARLGRRFRRAGTTVVVGLVGVQTNQFPRARDLAMEFKAEGFSVMIGGFHVSGAMALSPDSIPPECQQALDEGVTLVLGEVEERWADLLRDAAAGRLRPLYDFLGERPGLHDKPLPRASRRTQRKFALKGSGTIDAGRGCPFNCSFCTIINVQGRTMRCRSAAQILAQIRENYFLKGKRAGVRHYFFTDDNFARNPEWAAIFDGLIELREQHGMAIDFMMQVDVLAPRIPRFVEQAARAGCVQVFIGMETLRDDNLEAGGKRQNKAADYREMVAEWHRAGVVCHVGYIIGFPFDTYERVMEDVRALRDELLVDQASFFMLTPLPGSEDHSTARRDGVPMDPDYNNFDAFHPTVPHPRMSEEEWERAYRDAWTEFYSFEQMRRTLLRQNPHTYWGVLKNLLWYRAGMIERAHPMVTGFFRMKHRTSRRSSFPVERRVAFARRRTSEVAYVLREYGKLYLEMQDLWLRTRIRRQDYAFLGDLRKLASRSMQDVKVNWARVHQVMGERIGAWRDARGAGVIPERGVLAERLEAMRGGLGSRADALGDAIGQHAATLGMKATAFQAAFADLRLPRLPPLRRCGRACRLVSRLNVFSIEHLEAHHHLREYWERTWSSALRLRLWRLNPVTVGWNLVRDTRQGVLFLLAMVREQY